MRIYKRLMGIVVLSIAAAAVHFAFAATEKKYYAGAECSEEDEDLAYGWNGRVENQTAYTKYAFCPAIYNHTANYVDAWMTVYDPDPHENMSCTLYLRESDLDSIWSGTETTSGMGEQTLEWDSSYLGGEYTYVYYIVCAMPNGYAGSNYFKIYSYEIKETY